MADLLSVGSLDSNIQRKKNLYDQFSGQFFEPPAFQKTRGFAGFLNNAVRDTFNVINARRAEQQQQQYEDTQLNEQQRLTDKLAGLNRDSPAYQKVLRENLNSPWVTKEYRQTLKDEMSAYDTRENQRINRAEARAGRSQTSFKELLPTIEQDAYKAYDQAKVDGTIPDPEIDKAWNAYQKDVAEIDPYSMNSSQQLEDAVTNLYSNLGLNYARTDQPVLYPQSGDAPYPWARGVEFKPYTMSGTDALIELPKQGGWISREDAHRQRDGSVDFSKPAPIVNKGGGLWSYPDGYLQVPKTDKKGATTLSGTLAEDRIKKNGGHITPDQLNLQPDGSIDPTRQWPIDVEKDGKWDYGKSWYEEKERLEGKEEDDDPIAKKAQIAADTAKSAIQIVTVTDELDEVVKGFINPFSAWSRFWGADDWGNEQKNFFKQVDTLRNMLGRAHREATKLEGTADVGAQTDRDFEQVIDSIGALDPTKMGEQEFRDSLKLIQSRVDNILGSMLIRETDDGKFYLYGIEDKDLDISDLARDGNVEAIYDKLSSEAHKSEFGRKIAPGDKEEYMKAIRAAIGIVVINGEIWSED